MPNAHYRICGVRQDRIHVASEVPVPVECTEYSVLHNFFLHSSTYVAYYVALVACSLEFGLLRGMRVTIVLRHIHRIDVLYSIYM